MRISTELYLQLGHISMQFGREHTPMVDDFLHANFGDARHIEVLAMNFNSLIQYVIGTNRISTVHRRLASYYAGRYPIRLISPQFLLPTSPKASNGTPVSTTIPVLFGYASCWSMWPIKSGWPGRSRCVSSLPAAACPSASTFRAAGTKTAARHPRSWAPDARPMIHREDPYPRRIRCDSPKGC